jgi:hypothetical protein
LWFLLGALVVYRIGTHIPVPGINPTVLEELFRGQQGGILGLRRIRHTVEVEDTKAVRGMINKVSYLVSVVE